MLHLRYASSSLRRSSIALYRYFASSRDITSIIASLSSAAAVSPDAFLSKLLSVSKEDFNRSLVHLVQEKQYNSVLEIIYSLPDRHSYHNESTNLSTLIALAHTHNIPKAILAADGVADKAFVTAVLINMHCETNKLHLAEALFFPWILSHHPSLASALLDGRPAPPTAPSPAIAPPICIFLSMLRGYSNRGAWKQCEALINHIQIRSWTPSIASICHHYQLACYTIPTPSVPMISTTLSAMNASGATLHPSSLPLLLVLLKQQQLFGTAESMQEIVHCVVARIIQSHSTATAATTTNTTSDILTFDDYTSLLIAPSVTTTHDMITGLIHALSVGRGLNDLSMMVVKELRSKRIPVPDEATAAIIEGYCNAYRVDDAIALYDTMLSYGPTATTSALFHVVADCVIERGSNNDVENFLVKYSAAHASLIS